MTVGHEPSGAAPRRPHAAGGAWQPARSASVLLAFAFGYWPRPPRPDQATAEQTWAKARSGAPRVAVMAAHPEELGRTLTLPGNLVAMQDTLVFARANGYVRRWRVDIGDHVHLTGDAFSPSSTRQRSPSGSSNRAPRFEQRRRRFEQAQANLAFAVVTANRYQPLFQAGVISKQMADQANAQAKVWQANVNAAEANIVAQAANVGQYQELLSYGHTISHPSRAPSASG